MIADIASRLVFCEGIPGGPDALLLQQLAGPARVTIRPLGSKWGLKNFATRLEQTGHTRFLIVRDRDFDATPGPAGSGLSRMDARILAWPRHEIESYCLNGPLLRETYDMLRRWRPDLPERNMLALEQAVERAAGTIMSYEAARWSLASVNPVTSLSSLSNSWVADWHLPDDFTRDALLADAREHVRRFVAALPQPRIADVERELDSYLSRFGSSLFNNNKDYLQWFSGKDMLAALSRELGMPVDLWRQGVQHLWKILAFVSEEDWPPEFLEIRREMVNL